MLRPKPALNLIRRALIPTCVALSILAACSSVKFLVHGGERAKSHIRPEQPGPYVLIFAFDGAGYDQLMAAIESGRAPAMAGMLGKSEGGGLYEHAYSVPNAVSILPSTCVWRITDFPRISNSPHMVLHWRERAGQRFGDIELGVAGAVGARGFPVRRSMGNPRGLVQASQLPFLSSSR